MQTAQLIQANISLQGDYFENAIILITETNTDGAFGFIINRQFSRQLNELIEFQDSIPFPLYEGGPVDQDHLFFIHNRPDLIDDGKQIAANLYLGGDFALARQYINLGMLTTENIKICIGYCGWDPAQLENELRETAWSQKDWDESDIWQ